jgi:4-amino-4-deoxy-L-arabinose transferase-like glycosyltransferase
MERWPRSRRIALCIALAALLYLPGLGRPALWEPDEGRYAEIAREIVESGDWVTPRNNYVRYFEKPPLMYWATAASMRILGPSEFAVRLPVALFTIGQIAIICALGEAMFGALAGLLSASVFALSPLIFGASRFLTLDPPLAFFVTLALAAFYAAADTGQFGSRTRRRLIALSAAAMALGAMTKGLVAPMLSGAIALAWLIASRRGRDAVHIPWLTCAAIFGAITLPWFVLAAMRNPGFIHFLLVHEHFERYLASSEHGWGPLFFVPIVVGGTWPWIVFAPAAVRRIRDTTAAVHERSALLFVMIWFIAVFVFFSIPRSKLGLYVLPGVPPLAILAGYGLSRLAAANDLRRRRALGWFAASNLVIATAAVIAIEVLILRSPDLSGVRMGAIAAVWAWAAGSIAAFAADRLARSPLAPIAAILIGGLVAMVALGQVRIATGNTNSYRELARAIAPELREGCTLASYRHLVQSLPFYTGGREALVSYRGELAPFGDSADAAASFIASDAALKALWDSNKCVVLVANRKDLRTLEALIGPLRQLAAEGRKVAVTNRSSRH